MAAVPIIKRKDKQYSNDKEYMGKEFLIKDSLTSLAWKMEAETRVIEGILVTKPQLKKNLAQLILET
jgi:GLPGLI family protein